MKQTLAFTSVPKPVRIRIFVGGQEHMSLESLKKYITPDIMGFVDGRLQRWLKQQKMDELSEVIDEINKSVATDEAKLLKVYNEIFDKDFENISDYIEEWGKERDCGQKAKELLLRYKSNDLIYLKKIFDTCPDVLSTVEWYGLVASAWNKNILTDSGFCFLVGMYLNKRGDAKRAKYLITKARSAGNADAIEFFDVNYNTRLFAQNTVEELKQTVTDFNYNRLKPTNGYEDAVKGFIELCCSVRNENSQPNCLTILKEYGLCYNIKSYDILKDEKLCARALFLYKPAKRYGGSCQKEYDKALSEIPKSHPLQKEIFSKLPFNEVRDNVSVGLEKIFHYVLFGKKHDEWRK